ncbi:unnamed protein product, partial [Gulo gulo]
PATKAFHKHSLSESICSKTEEPLPHLVSKWDSAPASEMVRPRYCDVADLNPWSQDQGQAGAVGTHPIITYQLCWPLPGAQ